MTYEEAEEYGKKHGYAVFMVALNSTIYKTPNMKEQNKRIELTMYENPYYISNRVMRVDEYDNGMHHIHRICGWPKNS